MIDKSWKNQGDVAALPVYIPNEDYNLWRGGDWYGLGMMNSEFYESGNYLCIRELTLGYRLPLTGVMNKIFQNLKVNVTGNNLHYFTKIFWCESRIRRKRCRALSASQKCDFRRISYILI